MAAIKYKDPSTNLWEELGEVIKGKDAAYVGSSEPTDSQYTIWVDTSETGEGLVTSVNGQVGAVMVTIPTKVSDLTNDSGFVNASQAAAAAPVRSVNGQTGNVQTISLLNVYPVGSIYMSVNSTSPASLFGGTWERVQDTFLLAAGTTYSAGDTGGEAEHTLTVDEIPEHEHTMTSYYDDANYNHGTIPDDNGRYSLPYDAGNTTRTQHTNMTGGGLAHNNMPPYLAVYVWKRTA